MTVPAEVYALLARYVEGRLEDGETHVALDPVVLQAPPRPAPGPEVCFRRKTPRDTPAAAAPDMTETGLDRIAAQVAQCTRCALHKTRTRTVPGQGSAHPDILFVGEAPGYDEDRQGKAFVGRAGQLLTRMITAIGYTREQVFIGNILKCRPPNNRNPAPQEMETCLPYLREQIGLLKPKVIVAMGATAVKGLLNTQTGITRLRGTWHSFERIPVMPTFHPAYLLRNPAAKHEAWDDLQAVLRKLGKPPPRRNERNRGRTRP
ncbi:MAG: uracil-DNA glycosylase [Lentisphaerae bacterium]|nr:uracil-DNA glycosylase [Lentisphaerota bacterium]